jgi:hypothetical protein
MQSLRCSLKVQIPVPYFRSLELEYLGMITEIWIRIWGISLRSNMTNICYHSLPFPLNLIIDSNHIGLHSN